MESLPGNIMLKFNPDTLLAVRREFDLHQQGRIDEAVNILDEWVKKQVHFTKKDFPREYLETTIISCKGSVERAKTRLDKLCTFKTLLPNFFNNLENTEEYSEITKYLTHAHLPLMTPDHFRVYLAKFNGNDDIDSTLIFTYYRYIIMASEYMKKVEYTKGFILVLDYTDSNLMNLVTKTNIVDLRQSLTVIMEGYGMRLKGIHVISPSKAITTVVSLLKQVLSEKLGGRIHCHKSLDTLYDFVPKHVLPKDFGGEDQRTLKMLNDDWLQVFNSKECKEFIKEMREAKTIETHRQADKFAQECLGMPGSFRSLNVD